MHLPKCGSFKTQFLERSAIQNITRQTGGFINQFADRNKVLLTLIWASSF